MNEITPGSLERLAGGERCLTHLETGRKLLAESFNEMQEIRLHIEYLNFLRSMAPSPQEAQVLTIQIDRNFKAIEDSERHIRFMAAAIELAEANGNVLEIACKKPEPKAKPPKPPKEKAGA